MDGLSERALRLLLKLAPQNQPQWSSSFKLSSNQGPTWNKQTHHVFDFCSLRLKVDNVCQSFVVFNIDPLFALEAHPHKSLAFQMGELMQVSYSLFFMIKMNSNKMFGTFDLMNVAKIWVACDHEIGIILMLAVNLVVGIFVHVFFWKCNERSLNKWWIKMWCRSTMSFLWAIFFGVCGFILFCVVWIQRHEPRTHVWR